MIKPIPWCQLETLMEEILQASPVQFEVYLQPRFPNLTFYPISDNNLWLGIVV